MKADVLNIEGKKIRELELPKCFSSQLREDIVAKVLEAKKTQQPYAPSLLAGKQHSASGKLVHRRHVWRSQYGRGISRIPRKTMLKRGSQFNWEGATVPSAVGGMRAHPPKVDKFLTHNKINKKEEKIALCSAISATANEELIKNKYQTLREKKISNLPFVAESKILKLKTKERISALRAILKDAFQIALQKKSIRAGKGKARGRKYKKNAGLLMVIGKKEKLRMSGIEIKQADKVSVSDFAGGGMGRLTLYTEQAIKDIGERLK